MHRAHWLCTGIAGLMLTGCSSVDVISKKQMETESRLEQLLQSNTATGSQVADLTREVQDMKRVLIGQAEVLETLKSRQENQQRFLETIPTQAAPSAAAPATEPSAKIEVVNIDSTKTDKENPQQEAYMKAFGIFSADRYPEAITAFTSFIAAYPDSEYAANAQYWIGECHYTQKDYRQALSAFKSVVDQHPKAKKVPDALLKVAFSQLSLNDQDSAKSTMQKLIDRYPKSPAAAKARERLSRL